MAVQGRKPQLYRGAADAPLPPEALRVVEFGPSRGWAPVDLGELWRHRELLAFFVWRDLKVRYKQTALGAAWAVLKPVLTMVVFSLIFGTLLQPGAGGVPYPIFAYSALLPWTLFAAALAQSATSLVANGHLIAKVYFPRLLVPIAGALASLVDFAVAFVVLLAMMVYYRIAPGAAALALPLFVLLALLAALAAGLWLAALQVRFRDVEHVIPFFIQLGLFATPVAYPLSVVPEQWRALYSLNPMVAVVEGFRWALLGTPPVPAQQLLLATASVAALLAGGLLFFRRAERAFADVV